jgi:hypothetical protein
MWLNNWDLGFTDPERVGVALTDAISHGDWRLYFLQRDRVRQVTLADVNRVAAEWLRKDNRTVGIYQPTASPNAPRKASAWTWRPWWKVTRATPLPRRPKPSTPRRRSWTRARRSLRSAA